MKFLVDTQLPPLVVEWLIYKGHQAVHTSDLPQGVFIKDKDNEGIALHSLASAFFITVGT